jgi:hypothetical protein
LASPGRVESQLLEFRWNWVRVVCYRYPSCLGVRVMKTTMTVSLLFVAVLATILFLLVWYLTNSVEAARGAASFAVTALPSISSWLEQSEAKQSSIPGKRMAIRSFEGFSISLPVAIAVGTIVGVAIVNIASFFSGFAAGMMRPEAASQAPEVAERAKALAGANFANIPIFLVGFYLLGRWLSRRSRNAIFAVVLTALLTAIIIRLLDFLVASPEEWKAYYQQERAVLSLLGAVFIQFAAILVPSLLGFWRGRRERTSQYMGYLLSALPEDTQSSLVDLAFQEVRKNVEARRSR